MSSPLKYVPIADRDENDSEQICKRQDSIINKISDNNLYCEALNELLQQYKCMRMGAHEAISKWE